LSSNQRTLPRVKAMKSGLRDASAAISIADFSGDETRSQRDVVRAAMTKMFSLDCDCS
jgi:hypothetical protein